MLIQKLRRYGICGAVDFLKSRLFGRTAKLRRWFLENAREHPETPRRGVTIVASMSGPGSFQIVMNDILRALRKLGIPHQVFDTDSTPPAEFAILRYSHILEMLSSPVPDFPGIVKGRIAYWEFDSGLKTGLPHLFDKYAVIGMSDFNANYYREALPRSTPVFKLLYPLRVPCFPKADRNATRCKYGIPTSSFMVFFNFGLGSARKNPEGAIRAFAKAFRAADDAVLVFKTMFSRRFPEHLESLDLLAKEEGLSGRFITINDFIPTEDIYALTDACDVYMSLHHGEGFGLGVAEAMSLAKPVIVTDWSSTTEFCNKDDAIVIPFALTPIQANPSDLPAYSTVTRWADPDIDKAAVALRRLYEDRDFATSLGLRGRDFVGKHFSYENFGKSLNDFLDGKALPLPPEGF